MVNARIKHYRFGGPDHREIRSDFLFRSKIGTAAAGALARLDESGLSSR